ncbi:MAG TPA: hypothetical protein VF339_13585 [Gammaproteobacteria bacterium]
MATDREASALAVIALLFGGAAVDARAGCDQPPLVQIPPQEEIEGNESRVVADTHAYFQAMQEYVNCIRAEIDTAPDDASELYLRVLVQRNNNAVAEAEAVQRWMLSRIPDAAEFVPAERADRPEEEADRPE